MNNKQQTSSSTGQDNSTLKSKYVLTNTIKANKATIKLSKSINNVTSNKHFIGYDENDYFEIEPMCEDSNINLFVKGESQFNNTINSKNINATQSVNIGTEENLQSSFKLNVSGDSNFIGNNTISGTQYIKNNLVVGNKTKFCGEVSLNNSIYLEPETICIQDAQSICTDNSIDYEIQNLMIKNIQQQTQNPNLSNDSTLKFNFVTEHDVSISTGLISISKKFTIKEKQLEYTICFLSYGVYSNNKIISIKPIIDTITILNDNLKVVNVIKKKSSKIKKSSPKTTTKKQVICPDFNSEYVVSTDDLIIMNKK
jgi:hypothetical protein